MIEFKKRDIAELVSIQEIEIFENEIENTLPDDYKEQLQLYNGGEPIADEVFFEEVEFAYFYSLNYGNAELKKMARISSNFLPKGLIGIGATLTGSLAIDLNEGRSKGSIYHYYSDGEMQKLANSFTEFIEGLAEIEEED